MELLAGWIQLMQRELQTREWFDAFGDLFMALSSRGGQQAHGQFFTPVHICDLMVQCTGTDEKTTGKRMNDRLAEAEGCYWRTTYAIWAITWLRRTSAVPAA